MSEKPERRARVQPSEKRWAKAPQLAKSNPAFMAFSRVLHIRINSGRSLEALLMLKDIGAPTAIAHNIVDGWPMCDEDRREPKAAGLSLADEGAFRLVCFVRHVETCDWPMLITRATRAAAETMASRAAPV